MEQNDSAEQSGDTLVGHLIELKSRLVKVLWACFAGMILCYNYTTIMFDFIRSPIAPYLKSGGLVFTSPMDKFISHLKLAFFGGFILASPIWIYQIWKFVAPGLYSKEKKYSLGFIISGTVLFLIGVCFSYYLVLPMAFHFLMTYGGDVDQPMITIGEYLSFFVTTCLSFGAAFEMPLIITLLGMMGIINQKFLKKNRRYAIIVLAIVSAVITPPDLLSMLLMMVPMLVLYEISVFLVGVFQPKEVADM